MAGEEGYLPLPKGFSTHAIHHDQEPEKWDSMAVVTPLVTSTTFKQYGPADFKKYEYGRSANPTREVLENLLAKLDNGKHGLCFASGLGAQSAILGLLKSGENVISGDDIYGGTNRLFSKVATRFGIETTFVDFLDLSNLEKAIKSNTKMIWIETPTNPTLKVFDIKAVSEIAKKHNIILAVDNTFLTSYLQRPLDLGADITVYSLTKYMNGHSDVIMGALTTNNTKLWEELKFLQNSMGIIPSPFDCYQVIRGLKTLSLRMQQHSKNSLAVAKYLEAHPKIEKVLHPGLPTHPQHELSKTQTSGHCGMLTVYLKGNLDHSKQFLHSLKIFALAESFGGYDSLVKLPFVMIPASAPEDQRKTFISETLLRLSVGLEDIEDIIGDLEQALKQI
ncbi:unnamed protein product [Brassicogethes aeneus]|uniref:cystathionine gamma-lyase n=1 Tax=Brassicogethes aeneus TaxID=1431903 RepID=A0A9P0B7P3_BRAAE|nr:unnamed protein product [Brassicogethes aeneus]